MTAEGYFDNQEKTKAKQQRVVSLRRLRSFMVWLQNNPVDVQFT